jgi:hypothetical protein
MRDSFSSNGGFGSHGYVRERASPQFLMTRQNPPEVTSASTLSPVFGVLSVECHGNDCSPSMPPSMPPAHSFFAEITSTSLLSHVHGHDTLPFGALTDPSTGVDSSFVCSSASSTNVPPKRSRHVRSNAVFDGNYSFDAASLGRLATATSPFT